MKKYISIILAAALLLAAPVFALAAEGFSSPDYSGLVTDAYSYDYGTEWGYWGFHVPQINWPGSGIQAVNDSLWQQLYEQQLVANGTLAAVEQGYGSGLLGISYRWAVNGDVLSLWVICDYDADYTTYLVYNVSLSAGRRITDSELLAAVGLSEEEYLSLAQTALTAAFDASYGSFPQDEFSLEQRQNTQAEANVRGARPFLSAGGELYVAGKVYSLAGAEAYFHLLKAADRSALTQTVSTAGLPQQAPVDQRLTYFLEHCDSQVLTREDIEGFDEQMCLYARNGVYARSGRMFNDPDLQAFFSQFAWYVPTVEPAKFTADMLNSVQNKNIALVMAYEKDQGYTD